MPFVSVIMPVYNGAPFVEKAIDSIIQQTYEKLELLIVDNGSSDRTRTIIHDYKKQYPKRIKLYTYTQNQGAFFATNYALSKAKGRYIAMMDADDVSHKTRIAKQVAYLEAHPRVIVLGTQATIIDTSGHIIGQKTMPLNQESIYKQFAVVHPMIHPSVMINRNLLPNPHVLYSCKYGVNDDYYTFFKLMPYGEFANLSGSLLKYRVHGKNSSLSNMKSHFWNITNIRIEAITKLNYQAPFIVFPIMIMQAVLVALLPEPWLKELFYYIRGIKKISFHISFRIPQFIMSKLKSYAATFLA